MPYPGVWLLLLSSADGCSSGKPSLMQAYLRKKGCARTLRDRGKIHAIFNRIGLIDKDV